MLHFLGNGIDVKDLHHAEVISNVYDERFTMFDSNKNKF
jgi:hypothetical protein